jgi:uncharacterized protein YheU (UPF0270 family)
VSAPNVIEVPRRALSPAALRGVNDEYDTCASTDYGVQERTIEEKIADVERQLDAATATTNIVPARVVCTKGPRPNGARRGEEVRN